MPCLTFDLRHRGEFTTKLPEGKVIDFQRLHLSVPGRQYGLVAKHVRIYSHAITSSTNLPHQLLPRLIHEISSLGPIVTERSVNWDPYPGDATPKPDKLTQDYLWAVSIY